MKKSTGYVRGYEYVSKVIQVLDQARLTYRQLHERVKGSHTTLGKVVRYLVQRKIILQFDNPKFPFQHWLIANEE